MPSKTPPGDITLPIDLTGHAEGTGHKRQRQPAYASFMPPCNSACPAGENIQAWMAEAQAGRFEEAFHQIMADNPFPATLGRICVKPCENGCNRNHLDDTVNIHAVERYIGDRAVEAGWAPRPPAPASGRRVMVLGAGPAGLSAAYHLIRMGHAVEIFEAAEAPGGLLRHGIPAYRLPRATLEAEVDRILAMGLRLHLGHRVTDLQDEWRRGAFDAVFLSTGAQRIRQEAIETHDARIPLHNAFDFLRGVTSGQVAHPGGKVVVYGGGKLAMYIARIVRRLGAEATVLFPGDRRLMPAYDYEADDALSEGVEIGFLQRIHRIVGDTLDIERMTVEQGKGLGTGEWERLRADGVIVALAQEADTAYLSSTGGLTIQPDGTLAVGPDRMAGRPGLFAGGDMLPGESRSATIAVGHGRKAARHIDAWLRGEAYARPPKPPTAGYRRLHMWYKTEAPRREQDRLPPGLAVRSFDEVVAGLTATAAQYEAQRCLSCGNCFECDGCYGACPEDAIVKLGPGKGYRFDLDKCTGCAVCYEQCPCHAIEMIPEPVKESTHAEA